MMESNAGTPDAPPARDDVAVTPRPAQVAVRASFFFAFSFAWAGAVNVLPQVWLLAHLPAQRHFLLSVILLWGTASAVAGIALSQRQLARGHALRRIHLVPATLGWVVPLVVTFHVDSVAAYVVAYGLFRLVSNWLYNHLDQALVRLAGRERAATHVTAALVFQLLGMMAAPPFFSFLSGRPQVETVVLVVMALATVVPAWLAPLPRAVTPRAAGAGSPSTEVRFHVYVFLCHAAVMAFATQLIYLLRDLHGLPDAARVGGALLALLSAVSVAAAVVATRRVAGSSSGEPPRAVFLLSSVVFLSAMAIFALGPRGSVAWLVPPAVLAGTGYGLFLGATRLFATANAAQRPRMLSLYNNMPNLASLGAYGVTALLSLGVDHAPEPFAQGLLALLGAVFLLTLAPWLIPAVSPHADGRAAL